MKVKANGITFNCQLDGAEGAPWLVFSNSLATNLSMWDEQASALKGQFRILRYDQRGHGGTDAPEGRYTFDTLVADVVALFDAFSISRAHFLGLSMGGMTALGLAQRHPDRINRLIVCDCGPASTPQSAQQWEERIALASEKGMDALVEQTVGRWFPAELIAANPPFLAKIRTMVRTTPVNGFIGCAGALSNFDFRPWLGAMALPVLLIVGSKDATVPGIKMINANIPGSKLVELDGAGHLSNIDASAGFTFAVHDFLSAG